MGKASRSKGKRGEREFAELLESHGIDYSREQDGRDQPCDFRFLNTRTEVRRRETLSLKAWSNEIEAKTPPDEIAVVAYRTNGEPWRVALTAEAFLTLLARGGRTRYCCRCGEATVHNDERKPTANEVRGILHKPTEETA